MNLNLIPYKKKIYRTCNSKDTLVLFILHTNKQLIVPKFPLCSKKEYRHFGPSWHNTLLLMLKEYPTFPTRVILWLESLSISNAIVSWALFSSWNTSRNSILVEKRRERVGRRGERNEGKKKVRKPASIKWWIIVYYSISRHNYYFCQYSYFMKKVVKSICFHL